MPDSDEQKSTSSVHAPGEAPPFGSRFLTDDKDVWSKSAWDHVPPPSDQVERIEAALTRQRNTPVADPDRQRYNSRPEKYWDEFYSLNESNFFKDRKWLHLEFTELMAAAQPDAGEITVLELGCGVGNAMFPLLSANQNPKLRLIGCDYSRKAIEVMKSNPLYTSATPGAIHASVWDLASPDGLPEGVAPGSVDILVLIFVLSALHPLEWPRALANIYKALKPGGRVLLRDYGRHDMTQLRFKEGRLLADNFYVRGDGTRVYFFELGELAELFTGSAELPTTSNPTLSRLQPPIDASSDSIIRTSCLSFDVPGERASPSPDNGESSDVLETPSESLPSLNALDPAPSTFPTFTSSGHAPSPPGLPPHPLFTTEQLGVDRRLLVNRKRQLKMYRVWMQGKFRKR